MQIFSKSSHREEDDDEALKWAALERLPTRLRVKRSLLNDKEINVNSLGLVERKNLVERLVKITGEDNEKFLLKLKDRIKRVGLDMRTIEVRFEHLNIEAEAYIGSRTLPTIFNYSTNMLQGFLNYLHLLPSGKKPLPILQDVSGIIKPRRMTLLLGPPSSGKTTLLLALAGKLDKTLKFSGKITYNGHEMDEFVPQRTSAYISQYDVHIGEMTVRETLTFSARCQGVGSRYDFVSELLRREKEANIRPNSDIDIYMKASAMAGQEANVVIDYILKILGLEECADTKVGDDMIRGISGGQKRRLTTGEMLVGPARALFMDEISTGLDSSTTFQIVNSLRQSIHILDGTALISLLQPTPETYELFDDLILLCDGQIVYQGPRENVLEFFESMGFKCPERKGVADFLQEVTSRKDQEQYWCCKDKPYRFVSVNEFAEAFQSFHIGRSLGDELAIPFDKSKSHPAALTTDKYGISKKELLKACISREILLMKRNSFVYVFKMIQTIILALIASSVFPSTKMHHDTLIDAAIYYGALFYTIATLVFNGITELALSIMKLPVFYKQRDLFFYPSWAYALPAWIIKIPMTCVEVAIWVSITYYLIGFDPHISRFFKQYLLLICTNQMASGLFRLIAAIGRNLIVANIFGSFALVAVLVLGGFVLSRDDVQNWCLWAYWASPLMYAQNAISVNEFLGKSWKLPALFTNEPLGVNFLKKRGMFTDASWYWIGIGALVGYMILFNLLYILALKYLDPFGKPQVVISKEALASKKADKTGQFIGPSTARKSSSKKRNESQKSISPDTQCAGACLSNAIENNRRGMVLPFQPLSMVFKDIKYAVDIPQEMKAQGVREDRLQLLKGISGAFRPGVLTALMGVSGAGKTTLMDVLAGRKTSGYIEGSISISGYPKKQETFARISGYCEQNDIHSPFVTIYESLLYSAWLRLPPEVDFHTRAMFIEEVMQLVELTSLKGALVGLPGVDGLSIEQRKRLTIAVELVANPSIIFMDEPTSGLDARAAAIVMRTIRNTVDTGRTVVCTIHQPCIDIFYSFDELLLLQRGGEEIFFGRLGHHSCSLIKYFEDIQGVPKIKDGYNPATWMLDVTSEKEEATLGISYANIYRSSELYRKNKALIEELSTPQPGSKDLYFTSQYSQPFLNQCMACLWKQHWSYLRNLPYTAVKLFFTTVIALMFGTIFWGLGIKRRKVQDLFNSIGSMYVGLLFIGIQNAVAVQPVVAIERTVFYRERAAGMYSALPYAFGQVMIEVPYVVIQTIIYGLIVYAMIGFEWTVNKFMWYIFFMFVTFLYFSFYGMMTSAITPNHNIAAVVASAFYAFWTLFSGFIIPYPRIPSWWTWYYWCCPLAWTLYGLVASQFGDLTDVLETGETVEGFLNSYFGFKREFVSVCFIAIVGFSLLFCFIFAFSIRTLNFQRR